ncbi:uncharacterized protein PAC_17652 [Phialocephala subalpina]|uniref:Protein kinase domain-containing protein n=1 Tax=Phialocephala subalpina TaxID=576137 RepID=A0A1L7XRT8_9HELO|nr:uncharacterized protein PAC_17652 [Phialocephala subalpina]
MDPFTIVTIVVKVTSACLSTARAVYAVRNKYNDAPLSIVTISSETSVISACLSKLQTLLCRKQDFVQLLESRPELTHALDASLTGCAVLFSCLDDELNKIISCGSGWRQSCSRWNIGFRPNRLITSPQLTKITASSSDNGDLSFKGKAKIVWNHDKLRKLLDGLHRQQSAINFLIQLIQLGSLENIMQALNQNRPILAESIRKTQSLKQSYPEVDVPASIFSHDDCQSLYSNAPSITGASELEFEFDDDIVNSKVYRRALAYARGKTLKNDQPIIEGDLIDLSDSQTIVAAQTNQATQDLECLVVQQHDQASGMMEASSLDRSDRRRTWSDQTLDDTEEAYIAAAERRRRRREERNSHNRLGNLPKQTSDDALFEYRAHLLTILSAKASQFGDYQLGQTLSKGKHGKAKVGWKVEGGPQVAIKLFRRDSVRTNPTMLAKIHREIVILREVVHPNIVHLHEIVETKKHIGIILEYASGGSLFDCVINHKYIEDKAKRRLFAQIISGVGYLHKKGIVHRGLDVHNIFLDRNRNAIIGGFSRANTFNPDHKMTELIEYNLSKLDFVTRMELGRIEANGYRQGDLMETRSAGYVQCYDAPELVERDSLYIGRKIDIWSCGVILYAMLAGYEPWDQPWYDDPANADGANINLFLYENTVLTPLTFPEGVGPHARDLLRRILVPDPLKRADLCEIARHSWFGEYADMLKFISVESNRGPTDSEEAST